MDHSVINFSVYEDGSEFMGLAKVALPDVTMLTQQISGAGIAGNIEAVIAGHIEAMTATLNFRTFTENTVKLTEPRQHTLDMRVAQQEEDQVSRKTIIKKVKHILVAFPKKASAGSVAPASTSDGSGEYAVRYWATYIDGVKVREIDPVNFIHMVNGVDYLAEVRKALGK